MSKKRKSLIGNLQADVVGGEIDNPHYSRAHAGMAGNPKSIPVSINMRESPAALWYYGRSKSIDDAEYAAAGRFRRIWERAAGRGPGGVDHSQERVDGGQRAAPISDGTLDAAKKLEEIRTLLGPEGYHLVEKTCGECLFTKDLYPKDGDQRKYARLTREMLGELAVHFGFKTGR